MVVAGAAMVVAATAGAAIVLVPNMFVAEI
jgi:hypothetical protein